MTGNACKGTIKFSIEACTNSSMFNGLSGKKQQCFSDVTYVVIINSPQATQYSF